MKTFQFLFFFATLALFSSVVNAQMPDRIINESALFKSKYFRDQVWDAQRWPSYPSAGRDWKLSGLKAPFDASSNSTIDWGAFSDRYLMFALEIDHSIRPGSLTDERTHQKYNILLNLFARDGRFVKTISRWGNLIGFGSEGFMYVQQGQLGTFFAADREREGGEVIYRPDVAELRYLSDIINTGHDHSRSYSRRMEYNDDHRNDDHRNGGPAFESHRNEAAVNDSHDCGNIKITYKTYMETVNMEDAIRQEFGGKCSVADWADLKAIRNIDGWISCVHLNRDQTFMLTRNGKFTSGGNRQFFVCYSPTGQLPSGFLVHDQINNKLFLGSWYGVRRQILVKNYHNL